MASPDRTITGGATALKYGASGGYPLATIRGPADRATNLFAGGNNNASSSLSQAISLASYATKIDGNNVAFTLSGYAVVTATFHASTDGSGAALGAATSIGPVTAAGVAPARGAGQRPGRRPQRDHRCDDDPGRRKRQRRLRRRPVLRADLPELVSGRPQRRSHRAPLRPGRRTAARRLTAHARVAGNEHSLGLRRGRRGKASVGGDRRGGARWRCRGGGRSAGGNGRDQETHTGERCEATNWTHRRSLAAARLPAPSGRAVSARPALVSGSPGPAPAWNPLSLPCWSPGTAPCR